MIYYYKPNVFQGKWDNAITATDALNDSSLGDSSTGITINSAPLSLTVYYDHGIPGTLKYCYFKFSFVVASVFEWILEGSNDLVYWKTIKHVITETAGTHNTPVEITETEYLFRFYRLSLRGDEGSTISGSVSDWRLSLLDDEYPYFKYKNGYQSALASATLTSYLSDFNSGDQTTYLTSGASGLTVFSLLDGSETISSAVVTVNTTSSSGGLEWAFDGYTSDPETWSPISTGTVSTSGWTSLSVTGVTYEGIRFSGRQLGTGSTDFKISDFRVDSEKSVNTYSETSTWLGRLSTSQITGKLTGNQKPGSLFNYIDPKLDPACSVTWQTLPNNLWLYAIEAEEEVLSVRDLTNIPYGQTLNTSHLKNNKLYFEGNYESSYYPDGANSLIVWATTNPSADIFVDFKRDTTFPEIKEVLYVEDGLVNFSYLPAIDVTITRGSDVYTSASVTGGVDLDFASDYEWVKAVYKVDQTFTTLRDNEIYCYQSQPSVLQLKWEKGSPKNTYLPLENGKPIDFNLLNPNSYQAGFLCLSRNEVVIPTAHSVIIECDKLGYVPEWKEEVFLSITVYDKQGLPIPQKSITVSGNSPVSSLIEEGLTYSNNQGKLLLYAAPTGNTFSVTATVDNVEKVFSLNKFTNGLTLDNRANGMIALVVTKNKTALGGVLSKTSAHYLDGIPANNVDYSIVSELGSEFRYLNDLGQSIQSVRKLNLNSKVVPENLMGLSEDITIIPLPKDKLFAASDTGQSKLLGVENV